MPSQEGGGRHQGAQFLKCAPVQLLGPDGQAPTLVVVETHPLTSDLFAQDAVLLIKIVDDVLLVFVQPASEGNQQERKGIECQAHGAILAPAGVSKKGASGGGSLL